jgi:5-methylcytosine-specific restriction endonuclease McrA
MSKSKGKNPRHNEIQQGVNLIRKFAERSGANIKGMKDIDAILMYAAAHNLPFPKTHILAREFAGDLYQSGVLNEYSNMQSLKKEKKFVKNKQREIKKKYQVTDEFFISEAWIVLKRNIRIAYGKQCMCCKNRTSIMHIDHIKPRSKHKHLELDPTNLQVLCEKCNMSKSNLHETEYRPANWMDILIANYVIKPTK